MVEGTIQIDGVKSVVVPPTPLRAGFYLANIFIIEGDTTAAIQWQEGFGTVGRVSGQAWRVDNLVANTRVKVGYQIYRIDEA